MSYRSFYIKKYNPNELNEDDQSAQLYGDTKVPEVVSSLSGAKVLKTYDPGKYLLDESKEY